MRFHVLGIGPIGSLVAHHLRSVLPSTNPITLIHKNVRQANAARSAGGVIRVEDAGIVSTSTGFHSEIFEGALAEADLGTVRTSKRIRAAKPVSNIVEHGLLGGSDMIESLIVTTKGQNTFGAIEKLRPRISSSSTIVLLQNGLGIHDALVADIFRNPTQRPQFILAVNTHGAWLKSFYHVVHAGHGSIEFGIVHDPRMRDFEASLSHARDDPAPPRLDDICTTDDPQVERYRSLRNTVAALCSLTSLNVKWRPLSEVHLAMRRKVVVNAIINPLTALLGCRNGYLFRNEAARRIMRRVCQEAAAAYAAEVKAETQAWLDAHPGEDISSIPKGRLPVALSAESLERECLRVADMTRNNFSSMLVDVRKGNRTEIHQLNGYLMGLGKAYGVPMPGTAMLFNLVQLRSIVPIDDQM
ncbi:hypothetical protein PLICRDRAFT_415541 [Plicaturopsis crispa FD-325 SS-3]|nr:hypothetical protein PLICRDRAFT_415541 [Plicaturopsis crispa FD-325 SS-3]